MWNCIEWVIVPLWILYGLAEFVLTVIGLILVFVFIGNKLYHKLNHRQKSK